MSKKAEKKIRKAERTEKKQHFSAKSRRGGSSDPEIFRCFSHMIREIFTNYCLIN
jgi:hypothetical protein